MKKYHIIFSIILVLGALLRLIVIQGRDLFIDEVYYWMVSNVNTWKDIFLINHWIKDHGILYYAWLKILIYIIPDIPTLRYSNILLYVISSVILYYFLQRKNNLIALVCVAIFAFHRYFIFLSSTLSPYNLVNCLTIISVSCLLYVEDRITDWRIIGGLICVTVMAFYSDYSFYFMLPFYIGFFIYKIGNNQIKKEEKIAIGIFYFLTLQLVIPGHIQFVSNMNSIERLFANRYFEHSFFDFFYVLAGTIYSRAAPYVGVIVLVVSAVLPLFHKGKKSITLLVAYVGGIALLYISQRYFFSLFAERYLWFLYVTYILLLIQLLEQKMVGASHLVWFFMLCNIINVIIPFTLSFRAPGDISYEVKYSSILLNKTNETAKHIIILDNTSASDVLTRYYFGSRYPSSDVHNQNIQNIRQKITILSSKTEDISRKLEDTIKKRQKPCILYFVTEKKENILENSNVERLGCEVVYSLDNIYGYIDSFRLIYSKKQ